MLLSVNPGMCLSFSVNQNDFIKFSVYTLILWYSQEVSRDVKCRLSACHLLQKSLVNIWLGWNIHLCFLMHGLFKNFVLCSTRETSSEYLFSLYSDTSRSSVCFFSLCVFTIFSYDIVFADFDHNTSECISGNEKYFTIPRNSEIGNMFRAEMQAKRPASTAGVLGVRFKRH